MQEVAKRLAQFQPNDVQWAISLAYATRRADSLQAVKEILSNAESKFPEDAIIKYNLACYCCQLGESTFASGVSAPFGLAFDSAGNLFAASLKFTSGGTRSPFASGPPLFAPFGLVFDSAGNPSGA